MRTRPAPVSNTATIARNSFWFGLELAFSIGTALITSIIVARVIGPQRLDHYNYIVWLTNVTTTLGSFGLPLTTAKYMAECLNRGERGIARSIYRMGLKLQLLLAGAIVAVGLVLVLLAGDPSHRAVSVLLVVAMLPRMMTLIPSQANLAAELMRRNTAPSLISGFLNVGLTWVSLWIGWGLYGVAGAVVAGATLEVVLKLRAVNSWLGTAEPAAIPSELKDRMFSYSGKGLILMLLNVVVWDRSDLVILKALNHIPGQVTFFSLSFNFSERLLMIPNTFGGSLAATMMAQYGRGRERLPILTVAGAKYTFLLALPLLIGMASVSRPLVHLILGPAYDGMIPVLAIASVMAIPKALITAPTSLLQTTEKQKILIWIGCVCGALDIALDILLTPGYGARGAALANGIAQTTAAVTIWWQVQRRFQLDLKLGEFGRIAVCGLIMAAAATATWRVIPGVPGLALSIITGAVVWFVMLRLFRAIDRLDAERLLQIGKVLPERMRRIYRHLVDMLAAPASV